MFLKRLDIQGFKTFASRTIFDFGPGVSAIVGPNGSGKSNIADAVRWALGEQNPRAVRCRHSEDVIFAGSSKRAPVGMAEVTLTFDNSTNWLPIEFADVAITRRAYRSGENEYLINGARVRLRDVSDLLRRASLEAGGHVVVGQGVVDTVLSQRAEERKTLVESLAGLRHYYVRRDEAEGRLRASEHNLESIRAVIAETEPLLVTLAEQAEVARAYVVVRDELAGLLRQAYAHQHQGLLVRSAQAGTRAHEARAALATAQSALEEGRRRLRELAAAAQAAGDEHARLAAEGRRAGEAREEVERDLAVARARAESQRRRMVDLETDLARQVSRTDAAREEVQTTTKLQVAALTRQEQRHKEARALATGDAAQDEALRRGHQAVREAEEAAAGARRRDETTGRELAAAAAASTRAQDEAALRAQALSRAEQSLEAAARAVAVAHPRLAATTSAAQAAAAELRRCEEARDAARVVLERTARERDEARRALAGTEGRRDMLRRWLADVERTHPLLAGTRVAGVLGSVAQALRIPRPWHDAVAAVLGPALEAALVDNEAALLRVAAAGRGGGARRIAAVPLDVGAEPAVADERAALLRAFMTMTGTTASGPSAPIIGWADDLIEDLYGGALVTRLLARTLVVRDLEVALQCQRIDARVQFVTTAGEAVLAGGVLVYGRDEGVAQMLEFHEELARLPAEIEALRATLAGLEQQHGAARATGDALELDLSAASRSAAARAEESRAAAGEVTVQERLHRSAAAERVRAAQDLAECQQQARRCEAALAPLQERARAARDERARADATLATLRREHGTRMADRDARRQRQQVAATALSAARQEVAAAGAAAQRAAATLADAERELAAREAQRHALAAEAAALAETEERALVRRQRVIEHVAALIAAVEPARAHAEALRGERAQSEALLARQDGEHSGLAAAVRAADDGASRAQRDLETLADSVEAELGITLAALPDPQEPPPAQGRVRALRSRLSGFGAVNQRAVSDYDATSARVTFLRDQVRDLEEGIALLRGVIEEANTSVREQFTATVTVLEGHFVTHFRQLFGGGSCGLRATYDPDGMPAGVEVSAQPPGKRAQDLALLSGGERALVALALLFAMLAVRPVPFCLLDEVEAALDESNTGRFVGILRGLSAVTQFVLITHNRGTMVQADSLYGITMAESGTSVVASLALSAMAEQPASTPPVGPSGPAHDSSPEHVSPVGAASGTEGTP